MEATTTSQNSSVHDKISRLTNGKDTVADSETLSESASTMTIIVDNNQNNAPPRPEGPSIATLQVPRISIEDPPPAYTEQPAPLSDNESKHHNHGNSYKGFPSQEAYLAALNEWAETQKYLPVGDNGVTGFYGEKTLEEYARKEEKGEIGFGEALRRKMRRRRGDGKAGKEGGGGHRRRD
ncbi:hypothetical protein KC343_g18223 [Hortaea werneckii]|nr:hypothetical protein KC352_g34805 [Hortaea werneckii]KAI7536932.1 hypothetical protein KC317_g18245 [Hortaea werneckii]KAI7583344.1 hypothetical protein KC346_g18205 [Hortaea werneckii]KAI7591114.1 hypothetical protein KC343_g18223 [Hortaea werneckii]KAI7624440.1 hypothetical protein KC319_g17922 [Hortaea werneckii]